MKSFNSLVSVIIPAYNAENYIYDCISSVIHQSYRDLEIIVVNDGSTDRTQEILDSINDPRLIIIHQKNNGCSASKNRALKISNGNYIQYLDADDYLSSDKIEKQVSLLELNVNNIAVCKTIIISDNKNINGLEIDTELIQKGGSGKEFLLRLWGFYGNTGMVQPNAYLISRSLANKIGDWNEDISPSPDEDGEYFARVLLSSEKVLFSEGINFYRKMEKGNSLSQNFSIQRAKNLLKTVELKFDHLFEIDKSKKNRKLYQIHISMVVYQFGVQYPEIPKIALEILKKKEIFKLKVKKPYFFKIISGLVGFDIALKMKRLIVNKTKVLK
jgi:glycosyltransferase involved in cell wall biosynthesis